MKQIHYNPCIAQLTPYVPGLTEEAIKRRFNVNRIVKLASNENPLGPSPAVAAAVHNAVLHSHRYPDDEAPALRQAIANHWGVDSRQLLFGAGSSELIEMVIDGFVNPCGEIIVTEHGFGLYFVLGMANQAQLNIVKDNDFHQDLDAILNAINEKTRAIFIANPNNPTGTWIDSKRFHAFLAKVPEHVIVIADEAYIDYMTVPEYDSMANQVDAYPNLIVLHTFSKAYGIAGLRFGYALAQANLVEQLNRARKPFNVSNAALAGAEAAFNDRQHLQQSIDCNSMGIKQLTEALNGMGLEPLALSANFLTVELGDNCQTIIQQLLTQGIIIRSLAPYKMPNFARISVGTQEENELMLQALKPLL